MARIVFSEKSPNLYDTKRYKVRKSRGWRNVSLQLDPSPQKWWEDNHVVVAFNCPRISAALEHLMGNNVVRLTDSQYIKELGDRIDNEYRQALQKRIKTRELKEIERERKLVTEGKLKTIPEELAGDPTFEVDQKAELEIAKIRAKYKTNREINSELLNSKCRKWESTILQQDGGVESQHINIKQQDLEENLLVSKYLPSDEASDISSGESYDEGSTISMATQHRAQILQEDLQIDVNAGLLISKDQYDNLRYEDAKIVQVRNAKDISELFQLAEIIINGEPVEDNVGIEEGREVNDPADA